MKEKIIERILRTAQVPDLLEVLTQRLSQSDLQSLLLDVYRKRAHTLTPRHLLQQYEQNRFVQPATVNPKRGSVHVSTNAGVHQIRRASPRARMYAVLRGREDELWRGGVVRREHPPEVWIEGVRA